MQIKQQAYKGTRDFYPVDFRLQNYLFKKWSQVVERYGYERYDASILEHLELYQLKNQENQEILKDQIYNFVDRGHRQVALRPEMTPTVARMIASKRQDLNYPLRWYSIPNLWRYERPQRGRLREHWQLNVDCFGLTGKEVELELILIARDILKSLKADPSMYSIRINSRALLEAIFKDYFQLTQIQIDSLFLLFDRYDKMGRVAFLEACQHLFAPDDKIRKKRLKQLETLINSRDLSELPEQIQAWPVCQELKNLLDDLKSAQVFNAVLDFKIVRGFNYYTGIVFEIFDQADDNRRSMFGGGRYDNLLQSFGVEPLSGAGFGMGDVTMIDFLTTHQLLPKFDSQFDVCVILLEDASYIKALPVIQALRNEGLKAVVDSRRVNLAKKITTASKRKINYVLFIGANDLKEEQFNLKHLPSGQESKLSIARVISKLADKR